MPILIVLVALILLVLMFGPIAAGLVALVGAIVAAAWGSLLLCGLAALAAGAVLCGLACLVWRVVHPASFKLHWEARRAVEEAKRRARIERAILNAAGPRK